MKYIQGLPAQTTILDIYKANEITGLASKAKEIPMEEFRELILNQIGILESEIQEAKDAISQLDDRELLDAACDVFVVATGILQFASKKFDTSNALSDVAYNNLTKFPSCDDPDIIKIIRETEDKYKNLGIDIDLVINKEYNSVVFLNKATGKYLKPAGFKAVDLERFV